eukprot:Plantae.Rhodophyta-Purpureofilum_apyrenoidigerum.ctg11816.p1 GENE.Plantae.Rhodophyta-Purpureofilum_apyrenoidigerum.ctg11816~~Plantae.Rhodophyta-Purpureofilum_apyrenoidigerum.ctg11816.p1  ORF type:complete len:509 (+),score=95.32 Plantae.Rhodophyta-Purpureofilum_apyrenoidigerum.ctg11816:481-2007(+)
MASALSLKRQYGMEETLEAMRCGPLIEKLIDDQDDTHVKPESSGMKSGDMMMVLDLLFNQAGLDHNSSIDEVKSKLGSKGVQLVLRFYQSMAEKETDSMDSLSLSEVSDEEETGTASPKPKYKKDTEISINRIFSLGKVVPPVHPEIAPHDPYDGPRVITMTGFGELGRFGNQVLQYMFLRCYAKLVGANVQVPYWVGKELFGLDDEPVLRALPAVIETRETKANSTFTDNFLKYIIDSNDGKPVPELKPMQLLDDVNENKPVNVDIWGWFQWHTKNYAPFKRIIQDTLMPVPTLKKHFDTMINEKLRCGGKRTVVGCHLRLGDYKNISASSFGYVTPTSWYLQWLEEIWPTLDNPVLFVASDEIDTVLRDFAKFNPVTTETLGLQMPAEFADLGAEFFPDWYTLSQCDITAISNSTFSFSACMMNTQPGAQFYRAHYADKIVKIDPWNDEVIVHRDMEKGMLVTGLDTLKVLYNTQGTSGLLQNIFYELPYYAVRNLIMRRVLNRKR